MGDYLHKFTILSPETDIDTLNKQHQEKEREQGKGYLTTPYEKVYIRFKHLYDTYRDDNLVDFIKKSGMVYKEFVNSPSTVFPNSKFDVTVPTGDDGSLILTPGKDPVRVSPHYPPDSKELDEYCRMQCELYDKKDKIFDEELEKLEKSLGRESTEEEYSNLWDKITYEVCPPETWLHLLPKCWEDVVKIKSSSTGRRGIWLDGYILTVRDLKRWIEDNKKYYLHHYETFHYSGCNPKYKRIKRWCKKHGVDITKCTVERYYDWENPPYQHYVILKDEDGTEIRRWKYNTSHFYSKKCLKSGKRENRSFRKECLKEFIPGLSFWTVI